MPVAALANRTRFQILTANFATTAISVAILAAVVPFIIEVRMADLVALTPFMIGVVAIAGTAQIFMNERDFRRIVYFSHPDDPDARELEPVYWLIIKIGLCISLIAIVFVPVILWVYDVTVFDLYRMGMTGIVNYLLGDLVAGITLAVGLYFHNRLDREAKEQAPHARRHIHPMEVQQLADNFALRASFVSMTLWGFGAMSSAVIALEILKWGNYFALFLLTATCAIGVMVFPFQYIVFKRLFQPLKTRVLQSLNRSFQVASLGEASSFMQGENMEKGRILFVLRLMATGFTIAVFYVFGEAVPAYMIWTGLAYACGVLLCLAMTYGNARIERWSEILRVVFDGAGIAVLIQFAGSMTTPGPGIFFIIVMTVCLQKDFESAMFVTFFLSAIYGTILWLEYSGILPYAPYAPDNVLLKAILENGLWANYPSIALFALNFSIVAGGMLMAAFIGRHFRQRYGLDKDEQEDILNSL